YYTHRLSSPLAYSFFNYPATTAIYTLSLHDALPISATSKPKPSSNAPSRARKSASSCAARRPASPTCTRTCCASTCSCIARTRRSEEHTSELQSRENLVCRLLLEKKKTIKLTISTNN